MGRRENAYRLLVAEVYELAGASRRTSDGVAGGHGRTVAQWHVMSVLSGEPLAVPAIARRLGLARQSVQRVVDDLLGAGVLERVDNPGHRRSSLLRLTRTGSARLRDLVAASDADRAVRLSRAGVTIAELDAARATLRTLIDALAD